MPKIALQSKGFPCNSLYNGNFRDPFMELKNKHVTHQDGNVTESDNSMNSRLLEPHKAFYCNYQPDYNALLNYHFYSQMNGCAGHFYPFPVVSPFQCVPMYIPGRPQEFRHHGFQYYVVIDFEATCDKDKVPSPQEIIEFPSVLVNGVTGQLECCFQTYVRPTCNQHLTDFCKDLTGIQQTQVDRGVTLSEALLMHDNWLEKKGIKNTNFAVVTWTNWDCRVMLESECQFKKIQKPSYFNRWINLKVPFHQLFGPARCNLKEAVEKTGLAWLGRPHCGLDDAKNTARLLTHLMHLGFEFSITNSLTWNHCFLLLKYCSEQEMQRLENYTKSSLSTF